MDEFPLGSCVPILPVTETGTFVAEECCQYGDYANDLQLTSLEEATKNINVKEPIKINPQWTRLENTTSLGRGRAAQRSIDEDSRVLSKKESDNERNRVEQANKLLAKLRARNVKDASSTSEDFWSCVRNQGTSGKDCNNKDKVPVHMLPGGALIGKHHEEILSHIPSCTSKTDQKNKFMRFLKNQSRH